jgi:hypothetical protein
MYIARYNAQCTPWSRKNGMRNTEAEEILAPASTCMRKENFIFAKPENTLYTLWVVGGCMYGRSYYKILL